MLMEQLFESGVMTIDPERNVGIFRPEAVAGLSALRAGELAKFAWLTGEWRYENRVPATRCSPAYTDAGSCSFCERDGWICLVSPDGAERRNITFDPLSRQWIYILAQGSFGILRSAEGWVGDRIVFTGLMTMVGINCEWRMSWAKESDNSFAFVNEELGADGAWHYIDEWQFARK